MHACSHLASILIKRFLSHLNRLKYIASFITGLSVSKGSSCSVSSIAYFSLFVLIILLTLSYSLSSVELSSTTTLSILFLSVEQTCNKFIYDDPFWFSLARITNMQDRSLLRASNFYSYNANAWIEGISSHHTLNKLSYYNKVTVSGFVFEFVTHKVTFQTTW